MDPMFSFFPFRLVSVLVLLLLLNIPSFQYTATTPTDPTDPTDPNLTCYALRPNCVSLAARLRQIMAGAPPDTN